MAATCLVCEEAQLPCHVITALHLHIPRTGHTHALTRRGIASSADANAYQEECMQNRY